MGKLSDYELKKLGQQAVDFFEDTRDIINLGKVAHVIVNAVPAWAADNGEMAFYDGSSSSTLSGKRIYVRLSSSWEVFATAPFAGFPGGIEGSVQYNSSNAFGGDANALWLRASQVLTLSGRAIITGSSGQVELTLRDRGVTSQSVPYLSIVDNDGSRVVDITTSSTILIGPSANVGTGAVSVISIGEGATTPGPALNSVQLSASNRDGTNNRMGLVITSEIGGPHYIGDNVGIKTLGPGVSLVVKDVSGTTNTNANTVTGNGFTWEDWKSERASMNFDAVSTNTATGVRALSLSLNSGQPHAFFFISKDNTLVMRREGVSL